MGKSVRVLMRTKVVPTASQPVRTLSRGEEADTGQLPGTPTPALATGLPNRGFHSIMSSPTCPSTGQDSHLTSEPMSGVPREDRRDQPDRSHQAPAPVQGAIAENTEGELRLKLPSWILHTFQSYLRAAFDHRARAI